MRSLSGRGRYDTFAVVMNMIRDSRTARPGNCRGTSHLPGTRIEERRAGRPGCCGRACRSRPASSRSSYCRRRSLAGCRAMRRYSPAMAADLGLVGVPPRLTRTNWRPVAMLWPSEVLPTPGGPTKHRIGLRPFGLSFVDRQKLRIGAYLCASRSDPRRGCGALRRCRSAGHLERPGPRSATDRCAPSNTRRPLPACVRAATPLAWISISGGILASISGGARRSPALGVIALAHLLIVPLLAQQELALATSMVSRVRSPIWRDSRNTEPVRQQFEMH